MIEDSITREQPAMQLQLQGAQARASLASKSQDRGDCNVDNRASDGTKALHGYAHKDDTTVAQFAEQNCNTTNVRGRDTVGRLIAWMLECNQDITILKADNFC